MGSARGSGRCLTCRGEFWWRYQVGYESPASFAAPCPHCGELLRGRFQVDGLAVELESSDVEQAGWSWEERDPEADPMLNISTEVPLHIDAVCENSLLTPFIQMTPLLHGFFEKRAQSSYPLLHPEWASIGRLLPKMVAAHLEGNGIRFRQQVERLGREGDVHPSKGTPRSVTMIQAMRVLPEGSLSTAYEEARRQLHDALRELAKTGGEVFASWLAEVNSVESQSGLRRRAWHAAASLCEHQGPLLAAHLAEHMREQVNLREYRSLRGDYDDLALRYLRSFEAASKGLAYWMTIQNTVDRGNPKQMADGSTLSLKKMLNKKAYEREAWLTGGIQTLYAQVSRSMRNEIGHDSVHYDFASGMLRFDDGKEISLLEFQVIILDQVRLAMWAAELVAGIELLQHARSLPKEYARFPVMTERGATLFRQRPV